MEVLFVAFPKTYDDEDFYSFNFKNYFKSLFSVFVFFTSNNSPEILMKNYPENTHITTLFITLVWVNNMIVIGLLIGMSYYKMKKIMFEEIQDIYKNEDKSFLFERMLDRPEIGKDFIKAIFVLYMRDRSISEESLKKRLDTHSKENPEITKASEDIFWGLKQSYEYELVFSILNLAILGLAIQVIQIRDFSKYHYFIIVIALCCLSLFDFLNNVFFFDLNCYDRIYKTVVDTILNFLIIGISLVIIMSDLDTNNMAKVWAFLCLAKQFRLFLLIFKFDRQKVKSHIIYPFARYIYDVTGLVIVLFIIFGSLTLNVHGGNVHNHTMDIYNKAMKTDYEYHYLNFNTMLNSMTTLFVVTLNNNWTIIANLSVIADSQKKRMMKFIFVFFKFLVNYIFINSLIAFTIQIFSEFEKRQKDNLIQKLAMLRPAPKNQEELKDEDYSDLFEEEDSDVENENED